MSQIFVLLAVPEEKRIFDNIVTIAGMRQCHENLDLPLLKLKHII